MSRCTSLDANGEKAVHLLPGQSGERGFSERNQGLAVEALQLFRQHPQWEVVAVSARRCFECNGRGEESSGKDDLSPEC